MRLVIIGGSDAGISAALRAREIDPRVEVDMIVADGYPNFSICGLPFYLSGEVADWRTLAHRTRREIEASGVVLHLNEQAVEIDSTARTVSTILEGGQRKVYAYDRLVIATGASPIRPRIDGMDLPDVFVLHTMEDCFALHHRLESSARSAVIVGGGYIGLEMADALRHRGVAVTLVERLPSLMRTVDTPIALRVEALLGDHKVTVRTNTAVSSITQDTGGLSVKGPGGFSLTAALVLVVAGVRPQSELARQAGVAVNESGAIIVDRQMRTSASDIFAAGDCVTTWHRLIEKDLYMPLGTTSHKQGRVAGGNAVGGNSMFAGVVGTQSVKLFDRVIAATGLREEEARQHGFDPVAVDMTAYDHKVYYPGATDLTIRLIADRHTSQLLGGQLFGSFGKEVSKRIDIVAAALHNRMSIDALNDLDLSYTPPLSSPWDPLQMAAQRWMAARELQGRTPTVERSRLP
jgi:NADPH-dependent 2,4-dienoyl-CoA reductase/sulfur reductase-like enzyme